MSTTHARARLSATALFALLFTATTPVLAQTAWDAQDQADILRRLEAQGLVRSMEPVRARADEPDRAPDRLREADRGPAAGVDAPRRFAHEDGPRTPPAPGAAMQSDAGATTNATPPPVRERPAREL